MLVVTENEFLRIHAIFLRGKAMDEYAEHVFIVIIQHEDKLPNFEICGQISKK